MARILIVDDSPTETFRFREILTKHGYDVIEATNGAVVEGDAEAAGPVQMQPVAARQGTIDVDLILAFDGLAGLGVDELAPDPVAGGAVQGVKADPLGGRGRRCRLARCHAE